MSTPIILIEDDPESVFFVTIGKMFLCLIHLLHLFCIKLLSQSETIFTIMIICLHTYFMLSFIFVLFDLFEKYVNEGMSIRI